MRPRLKPVVAPLQVASLALGCVIGCVILVCDFLETAGPLGAALGITLGGLAMLLIARSYGLMVRTFPVAGAEFAYAYRALPMPDISDHSIGATCWPISCRV